MKQQKRHKPTTIWNKILKNPLWYIFGIFVLAKASYETYNNYRLENDGICATATIYANGKKGYMWYQFQVNGICYKGHEYTNKAIGDTLTIVYLPSNPKINRSQKFLQKSTNE